jgi:hypothetical protein
MYSTCFYKNNNSNTVNGNILIFYMVHLIVFIFSVLGIGRTLYRNIYKQRQITLRDYAAHTHIYTHKIHTKYMKKRGRK